MKLMCHDIGGNYLSVESVMIINVFSPREIK